MEKKNLVCIFVEKNFKNMITTIITTKFDKVNDKDIDFY
jgi:hypothetical protein